MRIAFGYKMGSGKDEAVSYLIKKIGGTHLSFTKPLYDIMYYAQQRCGFELKKDRKFLQYVGTDWARELDANVWARLVVESTPKDGNAFISDLRFPNEMKILQDNGWNCVKIVRPHQEERKGTGSHSHRSETALDSISDFEWDYVLYNSGSLNDYHKSLDELIENIKLAHK